MLSMSVSGQFLYFSLVSVFSGNPVIGASGAISGRKCIDGASMALLSGNVVEDAGGLYHANLYTEDVTGKNIGYLFSSSGCALVSFMAVTTGGASGYLYPASGVFVNATASVASGSLYLASGSIFKNTYASGALGTSGGLSTAWGNSGATTVGQNLDKSGVTVGTIISGIMSGQVVTLVSGQSYIASGVWSVSGVNAVVPPSTLSGVIANSGLFVSVPIASISGVNTVATASVSSGSLYLASGSIFLNTFASGVVGGGSGNLPSAWGGSGAVTVGQNLDKSGYTDIPISGQVYMASGLSFQATITSGQVWLASGSPVVVYSGQLSGQPVAGLSGFIYPASGVFVNATATVNSGIFVTVPISSISGVTVATVSGTTYLASGSVTATANSGLFVTVPPATLSGIQPISGTFVSVPIASISGTTVNLISGTVYPASGITSVVSAASLSGIVPASGSFVNVPINTISGVNAVASVNSGSLYLASGSLLKNTFASGVLAVEIPYGVLKADGSGITGEAIHSLVNAQRKLVNKWDTTTLSGFLTVFKEDASTTAYTQALTSQSGANPVVALGDA